MSEEHLDLFARPIGRRALLLQKKDDKRREHNSLEDRWHTAREELKQIEHELRDLEKEEIAHAKKRQ